MTRTAHHRSKKPLTAAIEAAPSLVSDAWGDWRPLTWKGEPGEIAEVLLAAEAAKAKAARGEALSEEEVAGIHNEGLIRDCYNTRPWVTELCAWLCGIECFETDPFANPTARGMLARARVKLDGRTPESDGLAAGPDGRPLYWIGSAFANGPHSHPERWVKLCALHGQDNIAVSLCPSDGTKWYLEQGLTCDLEVSLGRLNYDAPPGLPPREASPRASAALIWAPHLRPLIRAGELRAFALEVDTGKKKPQIVTVRPGFAGLVPKLSDRARPFVDVYTAGQGC